MTEILRPLKMHENFNGGGLLEAWENTLAQFSISDSFQKAIDSYQEMRIELPKEVKKFINRYSNQILLFFSTISPSSTPSLKANTEASNMNISAFGAVDPNFSEGVDAFKGLIDDGRGAHSQLNNKAEQGMFLDEVGKFIKYLIIPFQLKQAEKLQEERKRLQREQRSLAGVNFTKTKNVDVVAKEGGESFDKSIEIVKEEETQLNLLLSTWFKLSEKVENSMEILRGFLGSRLEIDLNPTKQATIDTSLPMTA